MRDSACVESVDSTNRKRNRRITFNHSVGSVIDVINGSRFVHILYRNEDSREEPTDIVRQSLDVRKCIQYVIQLIQRAISLVNRVERVAIIRSRQGNV